MTRLACSAALLFAVATAVVSASAPSTVTIDMAGVNSSGQGGSATLAATSDGVRITISLESVVPEPEPAQIETGDCSNLGATVYGLSPVVDGSSVSTVTGVTMDELVTHPYVIDVQNSSRGADVSCGDVQQQQ